MEQFTSVLILNLKVNGLNFKRNPSKQGNFPLKGVNLALENLEAIISLLRSVVLANSVDFLSSTAVSSIFSFHMGITEFVA